ncbi:HlyD family secretion protein [Erwinia phyllosphaerae]|uniref:HlyD family secretion protein n=1 Tax=Erwinia phyllosphaerae TaxID=2853256 RepID=UPI001FEE73E1|nr:HlyD family secretion protein [Erwinia phyllosphaerae]MBV4367548.1 HlyD family secretion protein [Erwinia phyllosphaerae]
MERKPLFRMEAVQHLKTKWLGKALLTSGYPAWAVAVVSVLFFILLLLFILGGSFTRRINVTGEVISLPHAITIFAPQQGFITKKWPEAGDLIKKGERLYQIDVSRTTSSGNVSERSVEAINHQIALTENIIERLAENKATTLKNLQNQLEKYRIAHEKSQRLITDSGNGVKDMRKSMTNYSDYLRKGLITQEQFANQRYLFYQQQNAWQGLNTQAIQEALQISALESELLTKGIEYDNQISQYQYQRSDLKRQLAEVNASGSLFITAPSDGKIESMSVTEGQMVAQGDSLAQLMPASSTRYYLMLWIPDTSVPYLHPGDGINLRYEAFPFEKYGQFPGRILSISNVSASFQEMGKYNSIPRTDGVIAPYYKVIVALEQGRFSYQGKPLTLASGMKAQATLFLEKRPIWQWMLSPYYDLKKSISGPVNE